MVVGSGFGGSVLTYRLREAGLDVCLLERGRPYPPDSFPRTPYGLRRSFWDPSEGLYGMFNVWSFRGIEALVSSALGGGSIIYANVLLRKDEKWFVDDDLHGGGFRPWPFTRADLDPHYDRVEKMLGAQRYPYEHDPYDKTLKTRALEAAAEHLRREHGLQVDWQLPPLAVTFANPGEPPVVGEPIHEAHPNLHGRTRTTCRLCGECDVGCNYGSKNTLDYNYLTEAQRLGAEIRTLCEVRSFAPRAGGGWEVRYVEHDLERQGRKFDTGTLPLRTVTAERLVLSAGTFGSTYLMLKNRAALRDVSERLGHNFCGNGDFISFALNARQTDEVSGQIGPRVLDPNLGPVITSTLRMADALDEIEGVTGRGFYIQDAGYPHFLSWVVESADLLRTGKRLKRLVRRLLRARIGGDSDLSAELHDLIGGDLTSTSVPLLGMGRDRPSGRLGLKEKRGKSCLTCDWRLQESRDYFDGLQDTMRKIVDYLDAKFLVNPTWFLKRVVTVHPLGGCPMGRDKREGVVDVNGEVFGNPGLYVADGSILPGPVGPNPSLTIAALADRIADHIVD